jgi:hypothetical protein
MGDRVIPPVLERTVLQLVRDGRGRASWHALATRLPSFEVPLDPDVMTVLKDLQQRGLVTRTLLGGGMDAWAITPAGEAALAAAAPAEGPLSPDELAKFAAALTRRGPALAQAIVPFVDDGLRFWSALRQVLASDPSAAEAVAAAGLFLPESERGPFAREMLDDPRPEVRAALFRSWTPVETEVPGNPLPTVPEAELDELLRRGLTDTASEVREPAAALTFLAGRGDALRGELIVNLGAPEPALRWWSILALGSAFDPLSLDLLTQLIHGDDTAEAAAAVRALGARRDGHEVWLAGLEDPRADVRDAALFALKTVVKGLDERQLAAISSDPRLPQVKDALAVYYQRTRRS